MRLTFCFVIILLLLLNFRIAINAQPPKAPSQPVTESFFGKKVTDRYRNLENLSDSTVMNWYKAEAAYTEGKLKKLSMRESIYREIKDLDDKFKYRITIRPFFFPAYRKNKIFFVKTFANEQAGKLYYKSVNNGNDVLIFDPNKNNSTASLNVISGFSVNDDGSKFSVVVTQQGNEVGRLMIFITGFEQPIDSIERVRNPGEWLDNQIFFYRQLSSSDVHNKAFLSNSEAKKHLIGKDASADPVFLSYRNNPDIVRDSARSPKIYIPHKNSRYIIGHVDAPTQFNEVYLSRIDPKADSLPNWYSFIKKEDQVIDYVLQEDKAFGLSVKDNKKGRILLTSASNPDWSKATIVAEGVKGNVSAFAPPVVTKDYLYYVESYGVEQKLFRVKLGDFNKEEIQLPVKGQAYPFSVSPIDSRLKIFVTSPIQPPVIYDYDEAGNSIIKPGFLLTPDVKDLDNIEVKVAYVPSYDGTRIPLTIILPKGIKKDGSHRVIIYGYGNYGTIEPPTFDPTLSILARHDVIKTIAHVRGGGELGEEWRLGGFKSTKPNTWKDAIACAEYMVQEGYTQPAKMAIMGKSAGGILAGRAMTERPDLFAVAIPQVGVLNTLRFEFTPNGPNHIPEFGTVSKEDDFKNLYAMDSYAHIKDGVKYPATLITGGLNDPRVILWQPGKFAAKLQEASTSGKPVWFRIDMHGGHGLGSTKDQQVREQADILSFILWQTNAE